MKNAKHTPGPWKSYEDDGFINLMVVDAEGYYIAEAMGRTKKNMEANARLIAAAPELLEALEKLCNRWQGDTELYAHGEEIKAGRAAIAKAKGQ